MFAECGPRSSALRRRQEVKRCLEKQDEEVPLPCPESLAQIFVPGFASIFGESWSESPRVAVFRGPARESRERRRRRRRNNTKKNRRESGATPPTEVSPTISTTTGGWRTAAGEHGRRFSAPDSDLSFFDTTQPGDRRTVEPGERKYSMNEDRMHGAASYDDDDDSLHYLPSRTPQREVRSSPMQRDLVPKLDLMHLQRPKRHNKTRQLLALDVANMLTNGTFSDASHTAVHFRTIQPGSSATPLFLGSSKGANRKLMKSPHRQGQDGETAKGRVSFTGPGFAPLPRSKGSTVSTDSVPLFRHATFQATELMPNMDSPRLLKARETVNTAQDDKHLVGMFKSKNIYRTRNLIRGPQKSSSVELRPELSPQTLANIRRDLEIFVEARDKESLDSMIGLLSCPTLLPPELGLVKMAHPWVSLPSSVRALAANELALLANTKKFSSSQARRAIQFLNAMIKQRVCQDEWEAALLALNFITKDTPELAQFIYDSDALPALIQLMHKDKEGVKAAAAQLCRNIFVLHATCKDKFRDLGGVHGLLSLLKAGGSSDLQLEGVYYLEDLILQNGEEISELIESVKLLSVNGLLEKLIDSPDETLACAAKQLYLRIAD